MGQPLGSPQVVLRLAFTTGINGPPQPEYHRQQSGPPNGLPLPHCEGSGKFPVLVSQGLPAERLGVCAMAMPISGRWYRLAEAWLLTLALLLALSGCTALPTTNPPTAAVGEAEPSPFRRLFGPSREEIWRQLSQDIGAQYIEGKAGKSDRVIARHAGWMVVLDSHRDKSDNTSRPFTRLRAPYLNQDDFRFTIYRKDIFSDIDKLLGMQDVEVGYPELDKAFIIQGNDETKLRALFANPQVRQLLQTQPDVYLTVTHDGRWFSANFPEGVDELCVSVPGNVKDLDRLKSLYGLVAETLDHLCRMGSVRPNDPTLDLGCVADNEPDTGPFQIELNLGCIGKIK